MEHVVFFPGPDGAPAFRRVPTLDEAVRFVEHLRNAEGVSEVSVQALTPVPLSFRTYYKVETPGAEAPVDGRSAEAPLDGRSAEAPLDGRSAEAPAAGRHAEAPVDRYADVPVEPPADDVPVAAEAPEEAPELVAVADGQPSSGGGKRSLGFFAH